MFALQQTIAGPTYHRNAPASTRGERVVTCICSSVPLSGMNRGLGTGGVLEGLKRGIRLSVG
jgi:hypothetical protein